MTNFEAWKSSRNAIHPEDQVPEDFLQCTDPDTINNQLSKFIVETRKTNGAQYPPATLHSLLCGVLRCMRESNPVGCPNFLDKKDTRFRPLQRTLDYYFNKLHSDGVGRKVKHAETISLEEDNSIWRSGLMDLNTPKGLQNATFYTVGKFFCLRGGQEHRCLKLSQLQRGDGKYIYHENVSKNRNGSFRQLHLSAKVVPVFASVEAGERCPVLILDRYIRRLPQEARDKDLSYVRPHEKALPGDDTP